MQARVSKGKVCIWAASVYPAVPSMELGPRYTTLSRNGLM